MSEEKPNNLWGCLPLIVVGGVILYYFTSGTSKPDPIYQAVTAARCALNRTAAGNMVQALRDRDLEAIAGLVERKQVFILPEGTRFAVSSDEPGGLLWGFVRSGRNTGQDCYVVATMVQKGQ